MTLIVHDGKPFSWLGFTDFKPVESGQASVWCGANAAGVRAFLKVHPEVGSFHREARTYEALQRELGLHRCLAKDTERNALLIADAGEKPSVTQMVHPQFAEALWTQLAKLHRLTVPTDPSDTQTAVTARWSRMRNVLTEHVSHQLSQWIERRIRHLKNQPRGWAHRDLRPSNVGWTKHQIQLIDFGQSRSDFLICDAIPFYAKDWSPEVAERMLASFTAKLSTAVMADLPLFSVLYLLGTLEQLMRHGNPKDHRRAVRRYQCIKAQCDAPLNFDDFFAKIS